MLVTAVAPQKISAKGKDQAHKDAEKTQKKTGGTVECRKHSAKPVQVIVLQEHYAVE